MDQDPKEKRIILVAVDASDASRQALMYALGSLYRDGDKLLLLSCYTPLEDFFLPEGSCPHEIYMYFLCAL